MRYKAFGFIIDSDFELPQLNKADHESAIDVWIKNVSFKDSNLDFSEVYVNPGEFRMCPKGLANMRVTDGKLIEIEPLMEDSMDHIYVYIMGSCMGAIIHQRGMLPLHGSCVTDGEKSILICGDSGSGKSTTASEFIAHGWKLLTDDVAVIKEIESKKPLVQSSYPSQKLWKDSLTRYNRQDNDIHSLYSREDEIKYGVDVSAHFVEGTVPLSMIVRLVATDQCETCVEPVNGFAKVEQIRYNTYRSYMVEDKQAYFQKMVTLGTSIPMALAIRKIGEQCSFEIYERILEILKNL